MPFRLLHGMARRESIERVTIMGNIATSKSSDVHCILSFFILVFRPVPPSTTPSWRSTERNVPKKHRQSNPKERRRTYSPSSFALTGISSSSRPLICAQPESPGLTSFAPYFSRSAMRSSWFQRAGLGPMMLMSPFSMFQIWGSSSRLYFRRKPPTRVMYCSGFFRRWVGASWGVHIFMERNL